MKHEHTLETLRGALISGTTCFFRCSCRRWGTEVFIPDEKMRTSTERDWGAYLVNMGMNVGRQFEKHARDGIIGQIISRLALLLRLVIRK